MSASLAVCAGCGGAGSADPPLAFRIENATTQTAEVTITIERSTRGTFRSDDDDSSFGRGETADLTTAAVVRVAGASASAGALECGNSVTLAARVVETNTTIELTGDGAGAPGFDEGSVGLTGERLLMLATHFECGDTMVVRIEKEDVADESSTDGVGTGTVTVFAPTRVPPVGDLDPTSVNETSAEDEPVDDSIHLTVDNQTASAVELPIVVTTEGQADSEESTDEQIELRVFGFAVARGTVSCGDQLAVRALIIDSDSGKEGSTNTLFQVVLFGAGTGTPGFDSNTIGPGNTRFLLAGEHVNCGDTVVVTILDDGSAIDEETDGVPRLGVGSVEVVGMP